MLMRLLITPEEGVPGYPETTFTPARKAPNARASFPDTILVFNFVVPHFSVWAFIDGFVKSLNFDFYAL
jgi:hypothetical protein